MHYLTTVRNFGNLSMCETRHRKMKPTRTVHRACTNIAESSRRRSQRRLSRWCITLLLSTYGSLVIAENEVSNYYPMAIGAVAVRTPEISYTDFLIKVDQGAVASTVISGSRIWGHFKDGVSFATFSPETNNSGMIATLINSNVNITGEDPMDSAWPSVGIWLGLATLLLVGIGICFRQSKPNNSGLNATHFGKSRARMFDSDRLKTTFDDVAGIEEAKQEVVELVDFLKNQGKYLQLGAKMPRGVLMSGAPGTGKTLLAKAIAGEAGVPFFAISGADFVEMYVGVGASRVRDLFDQAEKQAPCIIFIDEIDAVGRHRGASTGGGQDERDQTLNQLLVRMDGVDGRKGVIVIAATNRPDVLDPALLRPGRFDRQVFVPLPDIRGREQILRTHMRAMPLAHDVCTEAIARGAPGFSGADLANLVNEAALFAARSNKSCVEQRHFEDAKDKISIGTERRSMLMSEHDKELTAYHEAGHVLVSLSVPDHDPVYKVSVIPRGVAMGLTVHLPRGDRCSYTREYLNSRICSLLGGRVAEELIFGVDKVTTGASTDIQRATEIAHDMVTRYGMSDVLGPLAYCNVGGRPLSGNAAAIFNVSPDTAHLIDLEVRGIIERNYTRARLILECSLDKLHLMANALIHFETLDSEQISIIAYGDTAGSTASLKEGWRFGSPPRLSRGPLASSSTTRNGTATING